MSDQSKSTVMGRSEIIADLVKRKLIAADALAGDEDFNPSFNNAPIWPFITTIATAKASIDRFNNLPEVKTPLHGVCKLPKIEFVNINGNIYENSSGFPPVNSEAIRDIVNTIEETISLVMSISLSLFNKSSGGRSSCDLDEYTSELKCASRMLSVVLSQIKARPGVAAGVTVDLLAPEEQGQGPVLAISL